MYKKFWIPFFLCVIVMLAGCDQGQKMMKPVLTPETEEPKVIEPPPPAEEVIPEITLYNLLELVPGKKYRFSPLTTAGTSGGVDFRKTEVFTFGNVASHIQKTPFREDLPPMLVSDSPAELVKGFSPDAPKVSAHFILKPAPYAYTPEGEPVIKQYFPDSEEDLNRNDEIVIEIKQKIKQSEHTAPGGRGRDPYIFNLVIYEAVAIENLTHPDRIFEYE